jgi:penicillin-binding protein 1A
VTDVLKGVLVSGTAAGQGIGCAGEAGKTGTTDDHTDAWFVGYTPRFSTAVWVGYPDARTSMGSAAFGGSYAAPIWHDYMATAQGTDCPDFSQPDNPVEFSTWSGSHTVSQPSARTFTPQPGHPSGGNASGDTGGGQGGQSGQYPPNLYAPGAGQGPAPVPGNGGGDGGTGGGGTP